MTTLRRDRVRRARMKALFKSGGMQTANDYYHAALVLQHGDAPEDFLLAHELCVAAMMLGKNDIASGSLAAAAEDRFLMNIGRPHRLGTQYRSEGTGPLRLHTVDDGVTNGLHRLMGVPTLAEAHGAGEGAEQEGEPGRPAPAVKINRTSVTQTAGCYRVVAVRTASAWQHSRQ